MFSKKEKNKLLGRKVFTQGGVYLGVVILIESDPNSGDLTKIHARKRFLFVPVGDLFVIDRSQIADIDSKKITVKDSVSKISSENIVYEAETA